MDGGVRAYSTADGSIVWQFDTNKEFETVNGVTANGGAIDQAGPVVADGMVYVTSGYVSLIGRPGNVPGMEGPRSSAVGDRELDRYVQRLGFEIRMRNAIADRDPEGFR